MRIVSVDAQAVDCGFQSQKLQTSRVASPMSRFPRFAETRASWMWPTRKAFVRVEAADGSVGWGCTNGGEVVALIVAEHLSRLLVGEKASGRAELAEQMVLSLLPNDRSGFAMMAVAAVDIALWDLAAKPEGVALVDLLGGARADALPVYATTPEPERLAGAGFQGLKAAAPFGPEAGAKGLAANIDLLERFREAAGPDVPIMIDAFMAWDAEYALSFLDAAAHLDLHWLEDPLPPHDLDGLRRIRRERGRDVTLALGNFCFSRWDCKQLLDEGLVDILQPDVAWAGGITETLAILDLAERAEVPVILHNSCEQPWALALAASRQTDPLVEFVDRGDSSPLYELLGPRAAISGGLVTVPGDPAGNRPQHNVARLFEGQRQNKLENVR